MVVVGGGPAGSVTALLLARAGIAVTLIERAAFPRRKVCGEYQNCAAVAALDALGLRERVAPAASALRGIRLMAPRAAPVELNFSRPAFACDRATLDAILLRAADAAGVNVIRGRVEAVLFDGRRAAGVRCRDPAGELSDVRARLVVGADGAGSLVARKLGLTLPSGGGQRFAVGGHYRGFGDLGGYVEMYAGTGAYFAVNPLDGSRANVMVVVPHAALEGWSADVDAGMRGKAAELGGARGGFAGVERIGDRVATGPLAHRVRSPVAPGALLVGDAAGFLNPFTGQGVYLALAGAQAASGAIVGALARRASASAAFERYAAARERDFRLRSALCGLITLLIDVEPLARRTAARLARRPLAAQRLIDAVSGVTSPRGGLSPLLLGRLLA